MGQNGRGVRRRAEVIELMAVVGGWMGCLLMLGTSSAFALPPDGTSGLSPDEALAFSAESGRPLLAIATSPTCPPCRRLKADLSNVESVRTLAQKYVRLNMDSQSVAFGEFLRKFPTEFRGVPMVFVIRPDGASLYGQSGGMTTMAMEDLLRFGLEESGKSITPQLQRKLMADARASSQLFAEGKLLESLRLTDTSHIQRSFAKSVLQMKAIRRSILDEVSNRLSILDTQFSDRESMYGAAFRLAELYAGLNGSMHQQTARAMLVHYRKQESTELAVRQGIELVKARKRERSGNLREAISSYDRIIALGNDSPTASHAMQKLAIIRESQRHKSARRSSSM